MKIIAVSNFNNESVSDELIAENVLQNFVPHIVDFLNTKFGGTQAYWFYKAVSDDHKLYKFEP